MQSPHALYVDAFPREYGHPFWLLEPNNNLPDDYFVQGVQIGDVLVLMPDGGYDYLFNICRPKDDPVNAGCTYEGFEHLPLDLVRETFTRASWQNARSCLGSSGGKMFSISASASAPGLPVPVGAGVGFNTSHSSGALLFLPDGASRTDLRNYKQLKDWVTRNIYAVFEHVNGDRFGREATSIFVVTGCDKSTESIVAVSTNASDLHKAWLNLNVASVGVDLSYSSFLQCLSSTRVTPVSYSEDDIKNKNHCSFARGFTCTKRRHPIRSRTTIKVGDLSTDESWDVEDKRGGSSFWSSFFRSRSSSSSSRSSGSSPSSSTSPSTRSPPAPSLSCSPTLIGENLSNPFPCPELVRDGSDDEQDSQYQSGDDDEIHLSFPRTSRRDPWTEMNEHFLRLQSDYDYVISHTNDLPQIPEQFPLLDEDRDSMQSSDTAQSASTVQSSYVCSHCGQQFDTASHLQSHQTSHSEARPFGCPIEGCDRRYKNSSNLRRHLREDHEGNQTPQNFLNFTFKKDKDCKNDEDDGGGPIQVRGFRAHDDGPFRQYDTSIA